jgi:glyoxylase-like metal-dependent hydrolase (beta-lactamase superfamily II)
MKWKTIAGSLWMYEDSCNVYAARGPSGIVVINAGTGEWIKHLNELPNKVTAVLCTHFFRDHSAGAAKAARKGFKIYAPYWEQEQFSDPLGLFQRRETYIIYDNVWDLYTPIEPIPVDQWLKDWETVSIGGLSFRVIPTPGVTLGAVSLECELEEKKVVFCGEVIHSPGKIARIAPLQYNYNDLPGALNVFYSLRMLNDIDIDILAPSLGVPMMNDEKHTVIDALAALEENIRFAVSGRPEYKPYFESLDADPLIKVSNHIYQSRFGGASTWFILSDSGKILSIDYGYHILHSCGSSYPYPRNRRSILHGLDGLKKHFNIEGIDVVLVSHFHDDHVNGIPLLQRLYGTRCWAGENFAQILADPMSYNFPCTWPEPISVEPRPLGVPIKWEEYTFSLFPMSGHTRWGTLIEFKADGMRIVATGDQYFFQNFGEPEKVPIMHNHVYRNGALLESITESNNLVFDIKPDLILPGHGNAYRTNDAFYEKLGEYKTDYIELHKRIMPLKDENVHFNVDSRAGWLIPYRTLRDKACKLKYQAIIRNPYNKKTKMLVKIVGPTSWKSSSCSIYADARAETSVELSITPPEKTRCRRQPIALVMTIGNHNFGQVAEALVTIGYRLF